MGVETLLLQALMALLATVGFAVLFNVPPRLLAACGLVGMGGHLVRFSLLQNGTAPVLAAYLGALFIGVMGYAVSTRYKLPRLVFTVTGIITMIPGIPAYEVLLFFYEGNINGGLASGVYALLISGAVAAGLSTARLLIDTDLRHMQP
ncbi:MAG: threonine/serine exporter [Chloroflexi bacterium CFX4]|nr:threonine/serine exporter [Chloroflexi bacterium CFX4]